MASLELDNEAINAKIKYITGLNIFLFYIKLAKMKHRTVVEIVYEYARYEAARQSSMS